MNAGPRQLRAFLAIARLGGFTKAAEALHTTQPALSAQINQLEASLGVRLFDRSTRVVTLTQVGRDLLPAVEKTIQDLESLMKRARDIAQMKTGHVAVAALPSISSTFLPQAIADFAAQFPGVSVSLDDALAERIIESIRANRVDFGITNSALVDSHMSFLHIGSDQMVAVMPRSHRLAGMKRLTLKHLLDLPLIFMNRDSSVRRIIDDACAVQGRLPSPAYEAAFMSTAVGMVRAGLGVTLLPSSALELTVASDLACRPVADRRLTRQIGIVTKEGQSLSPAASSFIALLRKKSAAWFGAR